LRWLIVRECTDQGALHSDEQSIRAESSCSKNETATG
jgi:hypothetical protein